MSKKDGVEPTIRGDLRDVASSEVGERPWGFVPTQPDLRLSFPDFFVPAIPSAEVAAMTLSRTPEDQHEQPTPLADLAAKPKGLSDLLLRPVIMRLDGTSAGELFSLEESEVVLGRGAKCEIRLDDDGVSHRHTAIFLSDGIWHVKDVGSKSGTLLNARRVKDSKQLRDGAVISLAPGVSFVFQRISARHEVTLRKLFHGCNRDALTGAHNRRYVDERLCAEVAFALRHQRPVSVVALSIDEFRSLDEKHGNGAGDVALQRVAECARPLLRVEDIFGRYGREEFALVVRDAESFTAGAIAERLRHAVHEAVDGVEASGIRATISAGCALLAECEEPSAANLIALAKRRLSEAATKGGNRVVIG